MPEFALQILGSSSATPTKDRFPSSQYLTFYGQNILIDCGEGTQMQMLKYGKRFQKLNTILISHLHGDHYFGLIGLLSTMSLQGRISEITIIGPAKLKEILDIQIECSGNQLAFPINFIANNSEDFKEIYSVGQLKISTFPISHRIPCWAYIIEEKNELFPLNVKACQKNNIPTAFYDRIKAGASYESLEGELVLNSELVFEKKPTFKYAYVSDTMYMEDICPYLHKVNILYHEATFLDELKERAAMTFHTTAKEAAQIAKKSEVGQLIIGHFSARYIDPEILVQEAQAVFDNTIAGIEGRIIEA
jgi:ribonuclease Z